MTESEALARMIPPGKVRRGKPNGGVIQILVTSSCNLSCFSCTQASQIRRKPWFMTPAQFEQAVLSLEGYFGTVGVFGGCPTISPHFEAYCEILRRHVPRERCGLWANNLMGKGRACRATFNPAVSNLNVHMDRAAYDEMRRDWPESRPFGLEQDSRHSPPYVAMRDVLRIECPICKGTGKHHSDPEDCGWCDGEGHVYDEGSGWELTSHCPINQHWSAGIGVFRGELRAWFCEIAMAQSILHQDEPDYPDTGTPIDAVRAAEMAMCFGAKWWQLPMEAFAGQARKHCGDCGVPMQGYGELAQAKDGKEQVSRTHAAVFKPKPSGRAVELVTAREQLGRPLELMTDYLGNSRR
jgi:hypothetical protein